MISYYFFKINIILDARKIRCPETIMIIRKIIRDMNIGQNLLIITNDFSTLRDIPFLCHFMKHKLISKFNKKFPFYFFLKKCF